MTRWTVEHRTGMPTIVLPDGMDTSGMIEVATIGQRFARFLCHDGTEVDCAKYAEQMQRESESEAVALFHRMGVAL